MEKSTPLTQLKSNGVPDRDIIDNVLNELDDVDDYDAIHDQQQDRYRQYQHSQVQNSAGTGAGVEEDQMPEHMANYEEQSWMQWVWEELKSPLLFIVLFVVLNQPLVHKTIIKYLPDGNMEAMYSMGIRAVIGAILFYIIRKFILPMC